MKKHVEEKRIDLKSWFRDNWGFLLLLAFLVFISYFNSFDNAFISDDIATIKNHPHINNITYFWPTFSFLRSFIFFIIHKLFGLNPAAYRLVNVFFHLGCVWLVYIITYLLYKAPIPIFSASLFAVHPILTESVTWISGGTYAQYSFFILLAFLFYILSKENIKFYFLCILAFIFSLISAERSIIFVGILFVWEFASRELTKNWKKLIPFFTLSATIFIINFLKIGGRLSSLQTEFDLQDKITNPLVHIPIALSIYLKTLFFPKDLTMYYTQIVFTAAQYTFKVIIVLIYVGIIIYCYIKKKRLMFFWLSFFLVTLSLTLSPIRIASFMAERYVYLGSIGIIIAMACMFKKLSQIKDSKVIVYTMFSLAVVVLSGRTMVRNIDWKDDAHFWRATLDVSPDCINAMHNLANDYLFKGDIENAMWLYKKAIKLRPGYADPYNNLAYIYHKLDKNNEAIATYKQAISLNPYLTASYRGLAEIYFKQEKYGLALENILKTIEINPTQPTFHTNLGVIYLKLGEKEKAKIAFKSALKVNPEEANAKQLLTFLEQRVNIQVNNLY